MNQDIQNVSLFRTMRTLQVRSDQTHIIVKVRLSVDFKGPRHTVHNKKHGNSPLYMQTSIYTYL